MRSLQEKGVKKHVTGLLCPVAPTTQVFYWLRMRRKQFYDTVSEQGMSAEIAPHEFHERRSKAFRFNSG